jgi:hypothetical protein
MAAKLSRVESLRIRAISKVSDWHGCSSAERIDPAGQSGVMGWQPRQPDHDTPPHGSVAPSNH